MSISRLGLIGVGRAAYGVFTAAGQTVDVSQVIAHAGLEFYTEKKKLEIDHHEQRIRKDDELLLDVIINFVTKGP